jgi:hypothetical protein
VFRDSLSSLVHTYFVQILGKEWILPATITLDRDPRLIDSLAKRVAQWRYVSEFFREARQNRRVAIPVVPWLTFLTIKVGVVPTLDEISVLFPIVPYARLYQFYTGFLLELDCGLKLCEYGRVSKDFDLDMQEGVDWLLNGIRIACVHCGETSKAYYEAKKRAKQKVDVVLFAERSSGLNLVALTEIQEKIRPYIAR